MRYAARYRDKFDAGHRYTVEVTWEREGFPDTDHDEWQRVVTLIDRLTYELTGRDLGKMLGPHHPSAYGIASFFMERLAINAPVTKVEVHESDGPTAIIERDH